MDKCYLDKCHHDVFDAFEVIKVLSPLSLKVLRISKEVFETNTNGKFKLFHVGGGWLVGLNGNIDHPNPIEVEIVVGLWLSLAIGRYIAIFVGQEFFENFSN